MQISLPILSGINRKSESLKRLTKISTDSKTLITRVASLTVREVTSDTTNRGDTAGVTPAGQTPVNPREPSNFLLEASRKPLPQQHARTDLAITTAAPHSRALP